MIHESSFSNGVDYIIIKPGRLSNEDILEEMHKDIIQEIYKHHLKSEENKKILNQKQMEKEIQEFEDYIFGGNN